jgi:delta8-fatty-acid desaturase
MDLQLSRDEIGQLIVRGHLLVLHRRLVYRLNGWASKHPGGALSILHFVGRDAVDELEAYHPLETLKHMPGFVVARAGDGWSDQAGWKPLVPPVQLAKGWERLPEESWARVEPFKEGLAAIRSGAAPVAGLPLLTLQDLEPAPAVEKGLDPVQQHQLQLDYRALHDELIQDGFYNATPVSNYRWEVARYCGFFALAMLFYFKGTQTCTSSLAGTAEAERERRALHAVGLLPRLLQTPAHLLRPRCRSCGRHRLLLLGPDTGHRRGRLHGRA